jgi:hypothetical protein
LACSAAKVRLIELQAAMIMLTHHRCRYGSGLHTTLACA